jgi:SpoVK/Ycf46/Vps4 family AAA+-type ATPase
MVDDTLRIPEFIHPTREFKNDYEHLVGLDEQKKALLKTLTLMMDEKKIKDWIKRFKNEELGILHHLKMGSPMIILSGEVGCGKTALAQSIGTPLAEALKSKVKVFETPSNIRGSGYVGQISSRITEVFESVKERLADGEAGILIIDEADDLATSRAQNQAHHEDRAGLNVLIKEIDSIKKTNKRLAVILITNRISVLDPAVRRRTSLHLNFERPSGERLRNLLKAIIKGVKYKESEIDLLMDDCTSHETPYSFSDLIHRVAKEALFEAVEENIPFSIELFRKILLKTEPTPLLGDQRIN